MNISKILIIEDDEEINNLIYNTLKKEKYNIIQAFNGEDAINKYYNDTFQLVILDLMLPYIDGLEVLKKIREESTVPVIILSAKDQETDRVIGLGMGADDYIIKPFFTRELTARVKSQLRRYLNYNRTQPKNSILHYLDLELNTLNYKVFKKTKELNLTPKEFQLLKLFLENPDRVFTKAQIFNNVWENKYIHDNNTVMVNIKRLRNKIEDNPNTPKYISTVWGIGYKLGE
ncbi:response regulator transcription factor [Clostridium sp.]|uniref:response regulator transcription factor n=1 Tax=Clostridium sp. TaxID=1506 RepID=UPI002FDE0ECC